MRSLPSIGANFINFFQLLMKKEKNCRMHFIYFPWRELPRVNFFLFSSVHLAVSPRDYYSRAASPFLSRLGLSPGWNISGSTTVSDITSARRDRRVAPDATRSFHARFHFWSTRQKLRPQRQQPAGRLCDLSFHAPTRRSPILSLPARTRSRRREEASKNYPLEINRFDR